VASIRKVASLSYNYAGQTVVVTGAARGIGREIARGFLESGATVYMVDSDAQAVAEEALELGAKGIRADVTSTQDVQAVIDEAIDTTGRLDAVVNNAGILRDSVVWKMEEEDWNVVIDVHLSGTFRFTRAAIPQMRLHGRGRIINVTSYTGLHGNVGQANYAAAKAGVIGFTKTVAKEVARFGITVNAISPNARTRMIESIPRAKLEQLVSLIPAERFGAAEEMWPAVAFLASDEAAYVTGVVLPVDGGVSM
jgi:3-oxoacyl-[acyl-carrier protein] reductase